jgi:hypothetical protein
MAQENDLVVHRIRAWYDGHAQSFAGTEVVELPFIGLDSTAQKRLNDFKLRAPSRVEFKGKDVLDFGAGHARLAFAFPSMRSYAGVDYLENLVKLGSRRLREAGYERRPPLGARRLLQIRSAGARVRRSARPEGLGVALCPARGHGRPARV